MFLDLVEKEALGKVLDGGQVGCGVVFLRLVQKLKCTYSMDEEAYGRFYRMTFESRMSNAIVGCEDVDGGDRLGACLPVRVSWGRVLRGVGGKAGGDPP
jgi:hypothetical protein